MSQIIARGEYILRSVYYKSPLYPFIEEAVVSPKKLTVTPPYIWGGNAEKAKAIVKDNTFTFVGITLNFGSEMRWHPKGASKLWIYHLHSFEWLTDLKELGDEGHEKAVALVRSWLLNCNHFNARTWHPHPLSMRLISWITHYHWLTQTMDEDLKETFCQSLMRGAEHLNNNLQWDTEGHELIKNLKAMVYCGLCLPGHQSAYLDAMTLLFEQLRSQINPDGGHCEKSPFYHTEVLKDLLDLQALIRKAGSPPPSWLGEYIDRMSLAFEFFRYKDKSLALFNDGDILEKEETEIILKRCRTGEDIPTELPETGYVRLECANTMLMVDVGAPCAENIPFHGHADMLSFEMCHGTERVFVNGGTYAYQHKKRNLMRSTASHNTVSVGGENSAEVWGISRMGRRPKSVTYTLKEEEKVGLTLNSFHDGYKFLGAEHIRKIFLSADGKDIHGEDTITCKKQHKVMAHFHLHPNVKCRIINHEEAEITTEKGIKMSFKIKGGKLYDAPSEYAPHFGVKLPSKQLVIRGVYRQNICTIKWTIKLT